MSSKDQLEIIAGWASTDLGIDIRAQALRLPVAHLGGAAGEPALQEPWTSLSELRYRHRPDGFKE